MIFTRRFHTKSGSIYEVRVHREGHDRTFVRRVRLGEKHVERGAQQIALRNADGLDDWRQVDAFKCEGVGSRAIITLSQENDRHIYTNVITQIEDVQ